VTQGRRPRPAAPNRVHPDRPVLETGMPVDALDRYYWYMAELVAFCRDAGLATTGQKHEVLARVRRHLGGAPLEAAPAPARARAVAKKRTTASSAPRRLALDAPIGDTYKCDAETRAFFEEVIGPHFHFTAHLQRFRREHRGEPLTYGDLAREWVAEYERRKDKNYKAPIMHTWEYNNFVRDFLADQSRNAGKGIRDAAAAWNEVRQSCGPRDYASSIARASPPKS